MKRYLAFYGSVYYPSGGMDDFLLDFDSLDEAIAHVTARATKEDTSDDGDIWHYRWAHVWDSQDRCEAWKNP